MNKIGTLRQKIHKYQHLKCTFWIAVLAVIILILSLVVLSPWNSIFQNVFAGLFTGLVVTLIGSLKSKSIRDTEIERDFLKEIHDQYILSNKQYWDYRKNRHADADEYNSAVYDLASEMHSIEAFIEQEDGNTMLLRIFGKKPSEYFKDRTDYDLDEQKQKHKELIELIDSKINYSEEVRQEIDDKIIAIRRMYQVLNHKVFILIADLNKQKTEIETSVP